MWRLALDPSDPNRLELEASDPNTVSVTGWTALHRAAANGDEQTAEKLLDIKPELVFAVNRHGETALHQAIRSCSLQFIERLWRMNMGALRVSDGLWQTPFHVAIRSDKHAVVELFQWSLSLDEIVSAFTACRQSFVERFRPVLEGECEGLRKCLNQDVLSIICEYLGLDCRRATMLSNSNNSLTLGVGCGMLSDDTTSSALPSPRQP